MNINRTFSNLLNSKPIIASRGYPVVTTSSAATMAYPGTTATTLTAAAVAVGSVATFTSTSPHRLADGQQVEITGAAVVAFNGIFKITLVSTTVFTYVLTKTASSTTAGGTAVATYTPVFQQAILFADPANSGAVTVGPDENADLITLNPGDVYTIQAPEDNRQDMTDWWAKSATPDETVSIIFV